MANSPMSESEVEEQRINVHQQMADVITRHLKTVVLPPYQEEEKHPVSAAATDTGIDAVLIMYLIGGEGVKLTLEELLEVAVRLRLRPVLTLT